VSDEGWNRRCPICNEYLSMGSVWGINMATGELMYATEDRICFSCGYEEEEDVADKVRTQGLLEDIMGYRPPISIDSFIASLPEGLIQPEIHGDPYTGDPRLEWDSLTNGVFSIDLNKSGMVSYAGLCNGESVCGSFVFGESIPQKVVDWLLKHFRKNLANNTI